MRKRRRLANKLTIMVCAVLVAVSAFFYAPMEVNASDFNSSSSGSYDLDSGYLKRVALNLGSFNFYNELLSNYNISDNKYYDITFTSDIVFSSNIDVNFFNSFFTLGLNDSSFRINLYEYGSYTGKRFAYSQPFHLVLQGSAIKNENFPLYFRSVVSKSVDSTVNISASLDMTLNSFLEVSSSEGDLYEDGYNAGYSVGESAGYGNGYSQGFADGEASVDTGSIYDEAFQAGKDSVDTQSYYDAGYQAGYQVAYSEGYESGYDEGYQSAMDRIGVWGADTSDYPILVYNKNLSDVSCRMEVVTNMPSVGHGQVNLCNLDININPSHTYKIVFDSVYPSTSVGDMSGSQDEQFNYNIGLFSIPWSGGESFGFVQGSSLSSVFRLEVYDYSAHYYEIGGENDVFQPWDAYRIYKFDSIDVFVYDMGPSGDTQNHIANQTDQLTNGFDESQGNSVNSDLSSGLNEYQTAEDSLWATATTGLKDFTFFDFDSVPAMITGMSFITSIMGSWFSHAGGASGVGIVLSILFSVMLVAMVLGLYRFYQSRGGKK